MTESKGGGGVERTGLAKADEVADYLGTTRNQLARLRSEGSGPRWVKLQRSVRYRWPDVVQYVDSNVRDTAERQQ